MQGFLLSSYQPVDDNTDGRDNGSAKIPKIWSRLAEGSWGVVVEWVARAPMIFAVRYMLDGHLTYCKHLLRQSCNKCKIA